MKLNKILSLILALIMVMSCLPMHAAAAEMEEETEPAETTLPAFQDSAPDQPLAFGSVCMFNGCRTIDGFEPLAGSDRKLNTAQGIFVYERQTGTVIYSYNPDMKLAPGTLNKILTALIVIERADLNDIVTVNSRNISRLPGGVQSVKLKHDEQLTVKDLLYCLILQSANDAAVALAEHVAGNQAAFVALMEQRLKEIGCTDTSLVDIHGLNTTTQYTTARDMARIVVEATKNKTFAELFAATSYTVPETNRSEERKFVSQDYLMETTIVPKYNDDRVTGGYGSYVSPVTGASIVCTASNVKPDRPGLDVVCVILGATREFRENGWSVISYGNFDEMIILLEYIFNTFKVARVLYEGQALWQFPVAGGECEAVGQPHVNFDTVLPSDARMDNLIVKVSTKNGGLTAPIAKDELLSTVEIWYRNSCLTEAELFAMEEVRTIDDAALNLQNGLAPKTKSSSPFVTALWIIGGLIFIPVVSYLAINAFLRNRRRQQHKQRRKARRRNS